MNPCWSFDAETLERLQILLATPDEDMVRGSRLTCLGEELEARRTIMAEEILQRWYQRRCHEVDPEPDLQPAKRLFRLHGLKRPGLRRSA